MTTNAIVYLVVTSKEFTSSLSDGRRIQLSKPAQDGGLSIVQSVNDRYSEKAIGPITNKTNPATAGSTKSTPVVTSWRRQPMVGIAPPIFMGTRSAGAGTSSQTQQAPCRGLA